VYSGRTYAKVFIPLASHDDSHDLLWPESHGAGDHP
jgi:hypothetical protein